MRWTDTAVLPTATRGLGLGLLDDLAEGLI